MLPRSGTIKSLGSVLLVTTLVAAPVTAHEVKTSQDVGGTFHIEPDDNPRAGESALAWFALTSKGGQIIPLSQCNCKLAVHPQPHTEGSPPLLAPPLKAISAEQYQGVPSAEIVFPKAGAYELELSGTSKAGANFKPFELSYEVTVAPGSATQLTKTSPQTGQLPSQPEQAGNQWRIPAIALATLLGFGILWAVLRRSTKT